MTEEEITENLGRCPHFERCNQNLCPLDFELSQRSGGLGDKCRWMKAGASKPRKVRFSDGRVRVFEASEGSVMPKELLKYVPKKNIEFLNEPTKKQWKKYTEEK